MQADQEATDIIQNIIEVEKEAANQEQKEMMEIVKCQAVKEVVQEPKLQEVLHIFKQVLLDSEETEHIVMEAVVEEDGLVVVVVVLDFQEGAEVQVLFL